MAKSTYISVQTVAFGSSSYFAGKNRRSSTKEESISKAKEIAEDWYLLLRGKLRLMEGADIYQIAKNCRTSVEMIEKYYAAHIKTRLDAVAINVMRPQKNKRRKTADSQPETSGSTQPLDHEAAV